MSITYTRDDTKRRIRVTSTGPLTLAESIDALARQVHEGTWTYTSLLDLRRGMLDSKEDLLALSLHIEELTRDHGRRGPVAIVVREAASVGRAQSYMRRVKEETIEVFWDVAEATAWLDAQPHDAAS